MNKVVTVGFDSGQDLEIPHRHQVYNFCFCVWNYFKGLLYVKYNCSSITDRTMFFFEASKGKFHIVMTEHYGEYLSLSIPGSFFFFFFFYL